MHHLQWHRDIAHEVECCAVVVSPVGDGFILRSHREHEQVAALPRHLAMTGCRPAASPAECLKAFLNSDSRSESDAVGWSSTMGLGAAI